MPELDTRSHSRTAVSRWRAAGVAFLIATGLGFFFAAQIYYSAASFQHNVSWGQALYWAFGDWYEWALLSPVIFWLCRRFPFDRQARLQSSIVHLGGGLALAAFHAVLCALAAVAQGLVVGPPTTFRSSLHTLLANRMHFNLAVYGLIVAAWHAWEYYRRYRERDAQTAELRARLAQAQLEALRMQLNPHFLFNALNTISSLMLKDVRAANRMLARLGDLLRLALETSNRQEVPLAQELDFVRRYLEIEKIRFGDRLQVDIEAEAEILQASVPNLILQPLVENAVCHGIAALSCAGQIRVHAAKQNGTLLLEVSDNGEGFRTKPGRFEEQDTRHGTGVGIGNTRQRLEKLYGERHSFRLVEKSSGGVVASIAIPFRLVPA